MERLSSPPMSILLPVYVNNVAHAQVATLTPTLRTKSCKFNSNVEMLVHIEALEIVDYPPTTCLIGFYMVGFDNIEFDII